MAFGKSTLSKRRQAEQESNREAYLKLRKNKEWLKKHMGQWIGFMEGNLVTAAGDEDTIIKKMEELGWDDDIGSVVLVEEKYKELYFI